MSELTERVRRLLESADPAPWECSRDAGMGATYVHSVTTVTRERLGSQYLDSKRRQIGKFYDYANGRFPQRPKNGRANAELAAEAPALLRKLCEEIERLEREAAQK